LVRVLSERQQIPPTFKVVQTEKGIELNCCWKIPEIPQKSEEIDPPEEIIEINPSPDSMPLWPAIPQIPQNAVLPNPYFNPFILQHPLHRLLTFQNILNQQMSAQTHPPIINQVKFTKIQKMPNNLQIPEKKIR